MANAKTELQEVSTKINAISKDIGRLFSIGDKEQAQSFKTQSVDLKKEEASLKAKAEDLQSKLSGAIMSLPNIPRPEVPAGKDEKDNEIVFESGESPKKEDVMLPHWDLANKYNLIDFELGVKVTGSGFPFTEVKAPSCKEL